MRFLRVILTIFILSALIGCASGSHIVIGQQRPAINLDDVTIYLEPPSRYETIGIVEASSEVGFSTQAAQDRAIAELKRQASRIGANGVLLTNTENMGELFQSKNVRGEAIHVIQE